jgi:hypothetical protein
MALNTVDGLFEKNAGVSLRIETVNSIADLKTKDVDFAILWGVGKWEEYESRLLLGMPSVPMGNASIAKQVESLGIELQLDSYLSWGIVQVILVGALGTEPKRRKSTISAKQIQSFNSRLK